MKKVAGLCCLLLMHSAMACEISTQTPANVSMEVDNMRHGLKNELTLFLTVKSAVDTEFKRPPNVVDAQGRVSEPIKMEGALGKVNAKEVRQWVVYYTPVADFTAEKVVLQ